MSVEVEQSPDPGFTHRRPPPTDADEPFRQSLVDLSRQLASRTPQEPPAYDPKAELELPPEPKEPARRRRHGLISPCWRSPLASDWRR
jgi:hypothetical protein